MIHARVWNRFTDGIVRHRKLVLPSAYVEETRSNIILKCLENRCRGGVQVQPAGDDGHC